jgi:hypothetical protein
MNEQAAHPQRFTLADPFEMLIQTSLINEDAFRTRCLKPHPYRGFARRRPRWRCFRSRHRVAKQRQGLLVSSDITRLLIALRFIRLRAYSMSV